MVAAPERHRAHLVVGGYPPGNPASHDHDYARRRILEALGEIEHSHTTVAGDFDDLEKWLPGSDLMVTYTAGPIPSDEQAVFIADWVEAGGRWFALHGTSGGRARRVPDESQPDGRPRRRMLRAAYHEVLGAFFLNHPPARKFDVDVVDGAHPLMRGVASRFTTMDEPYILDVQPDIHVLMTAKLGPDNTPDGRGFVYDKELDTGLMADGQTRAVGFVRDRGKGAVAYVALGHNHAPTTQPQAIVDESVAPGGVTPPVFRGSWETEAFSQLLRNAMAWGFEPR
ncbi:MAG: ThuA domain-containing protein [Dehalococcoidia bacterium]